MSESAKKPLVIFIYVLLIFSTLLVYWQVRGFDFVNYDDDRYVTDNPHVLGGLTWDGVIWAFTTGYASFWHPMTWLSLMLDRQLFGPNPGWFHLVSVFLHLANTLLLFAVLKKMTGSLWSSAFVAAAFAIHPMHVESVAWIAERKDVLSTCFLLLTLAAYAGYVKRPSVFRYAATLALFAAGLMAKPMLITLPFLLLLLDYWPLNRLDAHSRKDGGGATLRRIVIEKIPFFVFAVIFSVITFVTQKAGGGMVDTTVVPLKERAENVVASYATYIGKMFWPQDMAVFYPFSAAHSITLWQFLLYVLLMVGVSLLVVRSWRSRKYLPVGWFWFVGTLVPVIGLVRFTGSSYADRFTYIPYIGLFIMIAWGLPELLSKWPQRKVALGISAAIVLAALGICAHRQASYWKNSLALFSHAITATQDNYMAYNNLGVVYEVSGRWQDAMDAYKQAIRIAPDYAKSYTNLGIVYTRLGRGPEAIAAHREAIRIMPGLFIAYNNLGVSYEGLGRYQDAVDAYKQAVIIKPDYIAASNNLANALIQQGRYDEAVSQYRVILRHHPDKSDCMNNLSFIIATYPRIKDHDANEAVALAARACKLTNDKNPAYLDTLAAAQASAGRFSEAVDTANKALALVDAASQRQLKITIEHHLSFYTQGKPYFEPVDRHLSEPNR